MPPQPSPDQTAPAAQAAQAVDQALDALTSQTPALAGIIAAFRPLKLAQARLGAELPALAGHPPRTDPARRAQGLPLAACADFLAGTDLEGYLKRAAALILPAIGAGFPPLAADAQALGRALGRALADPAAPADPLLAARPLLEAVLHGDQKALQASAGRAGVDPAGLQFCLLQMAKPLLEKRAAALAPLLGEQPWLHGACPICGSLPEMAYLQGEGGQRWLRCSLCAHHWRFARTQCPVCGNEDQEWMEFFFVEGRERERVDCCRACGKYVVTLDARDLDQPPRWEVAALGLVHLDVLAQEKGLTPATWSAWNQVG
ncbi:MAG: formate dehydrogenase accessory protein FdhE [Pseudomonadota bacterium]